MRYGASAQRNGARRNGIRAIDVAPPESLPDGNANEIAAQIKRAMTSSFDRTALPHLSHVQAFVGNR